MVVDTLIVYIKVIPSVADLHSFFSYSYISGSDPFTSEKVL